MREVVYVVLVDGKTTRVIPQEQEKSQGPTGLERVGKLVEDHAVHAVAEHVAHAAVQQAMPMAHVLLTAANPLLAILASTALASGSIDPGKTIGVLSVDQAGVRKDTLERCEREFDASGRDAGYPVAGGQAGYPVYLSPQGRERLASMPDGDLLHAVRSDESLSQLAIQCRDVGIYLDLGSPESRRNAERQLAQDAPALERRLPPAG
jgi:hypothetical protein